MLEIKFDPSTLTKAQREDLASFILGFESTEKLPLSGMFGESKPAISAEEEDPNEIFGAPSSVGAGPSLTAQEVTTATTSTLTPTAPPPPVPNNVTPGTIAAPQSQSLAEVDKKGMRWDARIHSSSKAKIADGTWKYRRGVTDDEIKKVEGELTGNPTIAQLVSPTLTIAPQPPAQPQIMTINPVNVAADPVTLRQQFAQLMLKVAKSKGEGKLTAEEVTAALQPYGVASLPLLANKLEVVPQVTAAIDAILGGKS